MKRTRAKKQARIVYQSSSMENLPSHILIEIISRLPIKSVMAISCVCKSLLSVVSDSHFQMMHSTRAPTELLVHGWGNSSTILSIAEYVSVDDSLTALDTKMNSVVFELPNFSVLSDNNCNFGATQTSVSLVNSCYGLLCFRGPSRNKFAVICNPFTREYITFPCPARIDKTVKSLEICYGLGFSPKDNNFKLLRLNYQNFVDTDSGREKTRVVGEIYTFGERGSWKMIANLPDVYLLSLDLSGLQQVIFHEGALHWYCTSSDAIVTFDFDTELFGKLVTPPRMCDMSSSKVKRSLAMGVFENCLYTTGCDGDFVDIWALKEYGHDSWVKIFSIQIDVNGLWAHYEPYKYLRNGQVLMFKNGCNIVCFNPDTGSIKNISGICGHLGSVFIRPSLVSLKVLLGDKVKVRSVKRKPCLFRDRKKTPTIPRVWTSTAAVKDVVKAGKDSQGCVPGSSAPRSSSEASASTSHPTEEKVEGRADVGSFKSQDLRLFKDTQKLADEIETLKAENERMGKSIEILNAENDRQRKAIEALNADNERQGKAIETLNAENDRQGKLIAKIKAREKKKIVHS